MPNPPTAYISTLLDDPEGYRWTERWACFLLIVNRNMRSNDYWSSTIKQAVVVKKTAPPLAASYCENFLGAV